MPRHNPTGFGTTPHPPGRFVGHVPFGGSVPKGPWYLRSYTRSTMRVAFPVPREPALAVYWGRRAGTTGEVGRFSATRRARVEGEFDAAAWQEAG